MSKPILGSFSKALPGSVAVNYGTSGGVDCDTGCQYHPKNPDRVANCYAHRAEKRPDRSQLKAKLRRHARTDPATITGRAMAELSELCIRGNVPPWLRISAFGSLPRPAKARANKLFQTRLKALLAYCQVWSIPVHIPVETAAKARYYRSLIGPLAVVRESATSIRRFLTAETPVSVVVPFDNCRAVAQQKRSQGRKVIICPAVLHTRARRRGMPANPKAKCGNCTACALSHVDIIYPQH